MSLLTVGRSACPARGRRGVHDRDSLPRMGASGDLEIRRGPVYSSEQSRDARRAKDEKRANGKLVVQL